MLFFHALLILSSLSEGRAINNTDDVLKNAKENPFGNSPSSLSSPLAVTFATRIIGEEAFSPKISGNFSPTVDDTSSPKSSEVFLPMKKNTLPVAQKKLHPTVVAASLNNSVPFATSANPLTSSLQSKHTTKPTSTFNWRPYASIASKYIDFNTPESTTDTETPTTTEETATSDYDKMLNFVTEETTTRENDYTIITETDNTLYSITDESSDEKHDDNLSEATTVDGTSVSVIDETTSFKTDISSHASSSNAVSTDKSTTSVSNFMNFAPTLHPSPLGQMLNMSLTTERSKKPLPTVVSTLHHMKNNQTILNEIKITKTLDEDPKGEPVLKNAAEIFTAETVAVTTQAVPVSSLDSSTLDASSSRPAPKTSPKPLATKESTATSAEQVTAIPSVVTKGPSNIITTTTLVTTTRTMVSTFNWRTFLPTSFGKLTTAAESSTSPSVEPAEEMRHRSLPSKAVYRMSMQSIVGVLLITLTVFIGCVITSIVAIQRYRNQRTLDDSVALMSGRRGQSRVFYYDTSI